MRSFSLLELIRICEAAWFRSALRDAHEVKERLINVSLFVSADVQYHLELFTSEEDLENASLYEPSNYIGVVFLDSAATSYRLRFPHQKLPLPSDYTESIGTK